MTPPVPLPSGLSTLLAPPDAAETELISRGVVTAAAPDGGLTPLQHILTAAVCEAMTGHPATFSAAPLDPRGLAEALARRDLEFRTRIVQLMVLVAMVLRPLPPEVADRVAAYAAELGVAEGMLDVVECFASDSLGLAAFDFERNGYTADWRSTDAASLHTSRELAGAWDDVVDDPVLAARWTDLEQLPQGTLGRRVADFYRARGFVYPGLPGSAPPLLAQHDWVHVLADYGTTVEAELEVFALIARANDDPHGFSLLAMVVSLFETGYLSKAAGLFEASPGHLSQSGEAVRLADAMRRGALCPGSVDFLRVDWFDLAHAGVEEVRRSFGMPAKSPRAVAAGSVGPWEPGGISPFQAEAGRRAAVRAGVPYDSFGARPAV